MATMLDLSLLKSPSFMLLALSGFLTMMGFFIPFMFVADRAVAGGIDKDTANIIITVIGATNTLARIVCGVISSFNVNALHLNNVGITLGGLFTVFSGLWITTGYQYAFAGVFGVAIGTFCC